MGLPFPFLRFSHSIFCGPNITSFNSNFLIKTFHHAEDDHVSLLGTKKSATDREFDSDFGKGLATFEPEREFCEEMGGIVSMEESVVERKMEDSKILC
jgi:hypothetical protein